MRLGILVSGRGSNLDAVLQAAANGQLGGMQPVIVISNRRGVPALGVARRHGVPARTLSRADFSSFEARDEAIARMLAAEEVDLALLAGYDQRLRGTYFSNFPGRTFNIHPALLPAHGGRGMMGLAVHRAVLAAGDHETGVTIHQVTPELDTGGIVAQVRVAIRPGESAEELESRLLPVEHALLVRTLAGLAAARAG